MKRPYQLFLDLVGAGFLFFFLFVAASTTADVGAPDDGFVSRTAKVDGAELHYVKNTGHWVLEENPKETTDALIGFLGR